jgi:PUA domain protein
MRKRDARNLKKDLSKTYGKIDSKKVEIAEFEDKKIYFLDERVEFILDENDLYPYLGGSYLDSLPRVVVDMGAIPFICNGADIMAPGILLVDSFQLGSLVVIRDITHGKAIAVGKAIKSSTEIELEKKGKVIQNLHYVGDKLWENAFG